MSFTSNRTFYPYNANDRHISYLETSLIGLIRSNTILTEQMMRMMSDNVNLVHSLLSSYRTNRIGRYGNNNSSTTRHTSQYTTNVNETGTTNSSISDTTNNYTTNTTNTFTPTTTTTGNPLSYTYAFDILLPVYDSSYNTVDNTQGNMNISPITNTLQQTLFDTLQRFIGETNNSFMQPVVVSPTREQIESATTVMQYSDLSNTIQEVCPIDLQSFRNDDEIMIINSCNHIFRRENLEQWFTRSVRCPVCRYDIRETTGTTGDTLLEEIATQTLTTMDISYNTTQDNLFNLNYII